MAKIAVIFFSGYEHTKKQAQAVYDGACEVIDVQADLIRIDKDGNIDTNHWQILERADAIIFGSPTYMGGPAWQFKKFADASSKAWMQQLWKDKLAAGFVNSGAINGDKFNTMAYFWTLAMQHGMVWVSLGAIPASTKEAKRDDINWLGSFHGAYAQSPNDASAEEAPCKGDLETARQFGFRVAQYSKKISK